MKNILIVVLTILCGVLTYIQFGPKKPTLKKLEKPHLPALQKPIEMMPADIIKTIEIHGISLSTPIDDVDELVEQAGFTCNKTDNRSESTSLQTRNVMWRCKHSVLKSTLDIVANSGQIQKIVRGGNAFVNDLDAALKQLYYLKSRMTSNEGIYIDQAGNNLTFKITHTKEDGRTSVLSYVVKYIPSTDPEDIRKDSGLLNVWLVR